MSYSKIQPFAGIDGSSVSNCMGNNIAACHKESVVVGHSTYQRNNASYFSHAVAVDTNRISNIW